MESDWPKRNKSHYVTEIVSWLGFADVIFGRDKRQPEIRLRSQATGNGATLLFFMVWGLVHGRTNGQSRDKQTV